MQLRRGQLFLEELVRQGKSLAAAARGETAFHQMRDDDETELQPLRLVDRHQVDGVDGLIQRRDLLVRLRRLGRVEVLEVGGEVVIGMLVAVGRDQLGELLHVGADLQPLDRPEEPLQVEVVRLLHHFVEEVVDAEPQRQAVEAPQVLGQTAGAPIGGFLQEIEEAPPTVSRLARPAASLHRVDGVAWQAQQAHQANGVVGAVDRAQVGQAILDLRLLIEAAPTADLVGDALPLQCPREVVQVRIGAQENGDRVWAMPPFVDRGFDQGSDGVGLLGDAGGREDADRTPLPAGGDELFFQAVRVFADQPARGAQDGTAATVVLLQPDDRGIGKHGVEPSQVGDRRAPKLVDALVVVTHDAQVALCPGEQLEEPALGEVRVLELIDHQVGEATGLPGGDRRFLRQELHAEVNRVVKVQAFLGEHPVLVLAVDERRFPLGGQHRIIERRVGVRPRPEFDR